ncbi:glycosyltransferase [Paenibacillus ihbetae]|nr:TPR domain-containing glycosyltransferase [Paenibacillus ihbetae]
MTRKSISLCMIVKNEERFLERCLNSVKEIANEIIVVDTGSTDQTPQIAQAFGAKVHFTEWKNDFSLARNESLKHATGEYILVLDADEYIDPTSAHCFDELIKDVYFLNIKSVLRGGISTVHPVIRLFRNHIGFRFTGKIHEQILISESAGHSQEYSNITIHHDGYLREVIAEKNKEKRNLDILQAELQENETGFGLFNLGMQYKMMGEYEKAIEMYKKAFPLSIEYSYITKLISSMIQCHIELKQYENALIICSQAIEAYNSYTDLYYLQGQIYEALKYRNDAIKCFKKCLELGEVRNPELMTFYGVGSYMAFTSLASIQFERGELDKAVSNLKSALKINKKYMPAVKLMIDITKTLNSKDMISFISGMWEIESIDDLKEMIGVLYKLRHPALITYSEMYKHNVDNNIKVIMYLYDGQYQVAEDLWISDEYTFESEQETDLLLCGVLLGSKRTFNKFKASYSFDELGLEIIDRIIERKKFALSECAESLKDLFIDWFEKLIILREFELIDYFVETMPEYYLRFGFARHLYKHGFTDVAFQLIESCFRNLDRDGMVWIGECLKKEHNDAESLEFYQMALNQGITFNVLEDCYEIYLRNGEASKAEEMAHLMKRAVPTSEYAKSL